MAVKSVKNVPMLLSAFNQTLTGTEWEGIIPEPTSDNIINYGGTLINYQPIMNRFVNWLVNRIAFAKVSKMYFTNPYGFAKRGLIRYGYTIEDIWVDIAQAHPYLSDTDDAAMLKWEKPNIRAVYHNRNREEFFKQTITEQDIRAAFTSEQGVADLVDRIINGMYTSNDVSEFAYTIALFSEYADAGKFNLVSAEAPTDEASAKSFLTTLRTVSNNLLFPSRKYNAMGVMNTTSRENQRLFITPSADANVSVQALAYAFHMEEAQFLGRVTLIPEIPKHPEIIAIVADEEFLNIYDNLFETRDFEDREKLSWNYWLHVWQTYFLSPFHNAVAITTAEQPTVSTVTVTGADTYTPGASSQYTATVAGTNSPSQAVLWMLSGNTDPSTRMDDNGMLYAGRQEIGSLTIVAQSYANNTKKGTKSVTKASGG